MRIDTVGRTQIMGILNVTPDSFSDGGNFMDSERAVDHAFEMIEEGADIIDVGGQSTRPFSDPVPVETEIQRAVPIIEKIAGRTEVPVSIDTYNSSVAEAALDAGARMINDVTALRHDPGMVEVAARCDVPVVLMHMKGRPKNMQVNPHYDDVIEEIRSFFVERMEFAERHGIRRDRIVLDPGIGFGKTVDHNLEIIRRLGEFLPLGRPLLLGSSRKAFIGKILDKEVTERRTGTDATVAIAVYNGARIVRVHDVRSARETATIVDAIKTGFGG